MIRHLVCQTLAVTAALLLGGEVWAQQNTPLQGQQGLESMGGASFGPGGLASRAPLGQDTGVKLSETSLLHVGVGAEGGYDTNVFYNDQDPVSAPILRVIPFIQLTNATRTGAVPSGVYYDLGASLIYREYLSNDEQTKQQRAFNPVASGLLEFSSGRAFSLILNDSFSRVEDPPYNQAQTGHITRDTNLGSAQLQFAPGGGRLRGVLRYTNTVDYFESKDFKFANLVGHEGVFDGSWLWLPKTALFITASGGWVHYTDSGANGGPEKFDSYPVRAVAGLRGLLTEKLSVLLAAGYANGFYQGTASTTGLSNLAGLVELSYAPTLFTNITLGYRHEFRNAVVGTFYDVDGAYLGVRQAVAGRLQLLVYGKFEHRRFSGSDTEIRTEEFVQGGLAVDYFVQEWFYAGAGYSMWLNRLSSGAVGTPDYTKHQIMGRLGFTY
jgi:hypothetical protein